MSITINIDRVIIPQPADTRLDDFIHAIQALEVTMSQFVEEFRARLAGVKQEISELNTVNESIKKLVEAQTAAINDLAQRAIDAPTVEEKNEILTGIQEIAVSVNDEVDEMQAVVQAGTPAEGIV